MKFVIFVIHQGLENIETFSSRPRPRLFLQDQDQDQDFYFKTKTICHVLEASRNQDQGLETTSLHDSDLCKSGRTDGDAISVVDSSWPYEHVLDEGSDPPWEGTILRERGRGGPL